MSNSTPITRAAAIEAALCEAQEALRLATEECGHGDAGAILIQEHCDNVLVTIRNALALPPDEPGDKYHELPELPERWRNGQLLAWYDKLLAAFGEACRWRVEAAMSAGRALGAASAALPPYAPASGEFPLASERPWRLGGKLAPGAVAAREGSLFIVDATGEESDVCYLPEGEEAEHDAALILAAVNERPALLAERDALARRLDIRQDEDGSVHDEIDRLTFALTEQRRRAADAESALQACVSREDVLARRVAKLEPPVDHRLADLRDAAEAIDALRRKP